MKLKMTPLNTKYAIVNADLDGLLSALLLQKFKGTEIVGFSDSGEYVWKKEGVDWEDCVFIDLHVSPVEIRTICNHIVALDRKHAIDLFWAGNKDNPNLNISTRSFLENYKTKFSLATVHYIIALLERDGHPVIEHLNLKQMAEGWRCIDVLLRADDVITNTLSAYRPNTLSWWVKMYRLAQTRGQGLCTESLIKYLEAIHRGKINFDHFQFKDQFGRWVRNRFNCNSPDGGYKGLNFATSELRPHSKEYLRFLSALTGLPELNLPDKFVVYKGEAKRSEVRSSDYADIRKGSFRGEALFSYAFVSTPISNNHFSYTVNLKRMA